MENKSAVEWLLDEIIAKDWWYLPESMKQDIIDQAREMEQKQLEEAKHEGYIKAFDEVEKYLDKK